jgi:hypothetical protein
MPTSVGTTVNDGILTSPERAQVSVGAARVGVSVRCHRRANREENGAGPDPNRRVFVN